MSLTVFLAVLLAAALHAGWNALAKGGADKELSMAAVVIGHAPLGLLVLAVAPWPEWEAWPFVLLSMGLHFGYQVFLMNAYRVGDLTQVYPIARGTGPLIVALVTTGLMGAHLSGQEWLAICVITAGLFSLALVRGRDGLRNRAATALALVTGAFIACYSLSDGVGARVAGTPWSYFAMLSVLNSVVFAGFMVWWRPGVLSRLARGEARRTFWMGGAASFAAYSIVVWAFTQAPLALVTALRETSIVFALLIGVGLMGERLNLGKVFSTFVTLAGAALLRLGKG
ncbi:EamA family transporter [Wenxinia saemankumensis]|uniref:EamA-like transporter family protein n=1 Tax=Wenxinia saemankumensis TaxID=1447782 RepID=A0A1M6FIM9_9RHOB|nr:EamA family transporter [Wenxinia saemankumensis]SHI97608.1 EamA-like transporter family protein [Wenxinia saemankumensis]